MGSSTRTAGHRRSLTKLLAVDTAVEPRSARWHRRRLLRRWLEVWAGSAVLASALSFFVGMLSRPGDSHDATGAWFSVWVTSYSELAPLAAATSVSTLAVIGVTLFVATSVAEARPSPEWLSSAETARQAALDGAIVGVYLVGGGVLVWLHLPTLFGPVRHAALDALVVVATSALLALLAALHVARPEVLGRRGEQASQLARRADDLLARLGQERQPTFVRALAILAVAGVLAGAVVAPSMWMLVGEYRAYADVQVVICWAALTAALHVSVWPWLSAGTVAERYVRRARTYYHWWFVVALGTVDASVVAAMFLLGKWLAAGMAIALIVVRALAVHRLAMAPLARSLGYRRAERLRDAYERTVRDLVAESSD